MTKVMPKKELFVRYHLYLNSVPFKKKNCVKCFWPLYFQYLYHLFHMLMSKPFKIWVRFVASKHRKRIHIYQYIREGKGRRCCLGDRFASYLHQDDWKNRMKSSYSSNRPGANHPILSIVLAQNSWYTPKRNIRSNFNNLTNNKKHVLNTIKTK